MSSEPSSGKYDDYEDAGKGADDYAADRHGYNAYSASKLDEDGKAAPDYAQPTPLIRDAMRFCWSEKFLNVFRGFFQAHAGVFSDFAEGKTEEHDLRFKALYDEYLELYEDTLTGFLEKANARPDDLYRDVRLLQDGRMRPDVKLFCDALLASCDYDSFLKVMVREARAQSRSARARGT